MATSYSKSMADGGWEEDDLFLPITNMNQLKRQNTAFRFVRQVATQVPQDEMDIPSGYLSIVQGIVRCLVSGKGVK